MDKIKLRSVIKQNSWDKHFKDVISENDLLNLLGKESIADVDDNDLDMVMEFFETQQHVQEQEKQEQEKEKVDEAKKKERKAKKETKAKKAELVEEMKAKAREEEEKAQKIAESFNGSILCKNQDIRKYYSRLRKGVEITAKGYFNSLFLQGKAGLGKTFQVIAQLNEMGFKLNNESNLGVDKNRSHYTVFSGDMSLAYLYRFLYEHNGKLIIFRDLVKLINSLRTIDILKAVTETHGKRVVQKGLYSKEQQDLPNGFVCESRFIFEMNSLGFRGDLKADVEALLSRGDYVNMVFSFEEIADIMRQIAKNKKEKEVTDFLIDNYRFVGWNNFNLRVQNKAFNIHKYAEDKRIDWKQELTEFLKSEMTETRRQLYAYIGEKAIQSAHLKRLLVTTHTDNCYNLRTADRRIREYVLMRELFIVGFVSNEDEELEAYMDSHRKYYLSLNPIENPELSDISDTKEARQLVHKESETEK